VLQAARGAPVEWLAVGPTELLQEAGQQARGTESRFSSAG